MIPKVEGLGSYCCGKKSDKPVRQLVSLLHALWNTKGPKYIWILPDGKLGNCE